MKTPKIIDEILDKIRIVKDAKTKEEAKFAAKQIEKILQELQEEATKEDD